MANYRSDINASNNLLAGWDLSGERTVIKHRLSEGDLKVLVLDDCYSDWKNTYDIIFGVGNHESIPDCNKEYFIEQRKSNYSEFRNILKQKIPSLDLIIFDLYFTESHEDYVSNPENIKNISGYEIYRIVKGFDQSIPLMVFSTSNKIWTFKLFNSMGIDGFTSKNPIIDANEIELKSFYLDFENTFIKLLKPEYFHLRKVFNSLNTFRDTKHNGYWWYDTLTGRKELKKNYIYENLTMAYLSVRRFLSSQHDYEISVQYLDLKITSITANGDGFAQLSGKKYFVKGASRSDIGKKIKIEINGMVEDKQLVFAQKVDFEPNDFEFDSFTCSSIVSQLGKISEIIFNTISASGISNPLFKYITDLRNNAAHSFSGHWFNIKDVFIVMHLVLIALNSKMEPLPKLKPLKQGRTLKEVHRNFLALIEFDGTIDDSLKNLIEGRIKELR